MANKAFWGSVKGYPYDDSIADCDLPDLGAPKMRYLFTSRTMTCKAMTVGTLLAATIGTTTSAGVIRHDVDDALYQQLGQQSQFASVGSISINFAGGGGTTCSGTLIGNGEWILTAAHCVDNGPVSSAIFANESAFGFVNEIIIHPDWSFNDFLGGGDIALLRLSAPITSLQSAEIYAGHDELGEVGTAVGFGRFGTGLTGQQPGTGGIRRAGNNVLDVLGTERGWDERILLTDFDSPLNVNESLYGDEVPLDLEYSVAPGDSGGGMFIETADGWQIAGINSFVNSLDGNPDGDYGDSNGFTRVSAYAGWINSIIPAPSTLPMLVMGMMVGTRRNRR